MRTVLKRLFPLRPQPRPYPIPCFTLRHFPSTLVVHKTPFSTTPIGKRPTKISRSQESVKHEVEAETLPSHEPIEEELLQGYDPHRFCTIHPGDVFKGRYEAIAKIGWGSVSTVWLAKDLKKSSNDAEDPVYVTLKVSTCDAYDKDEAKHELAVMERLHEANPKHKGFEYIRTYDESFEVETPHGTHVCLVQEPMRESLRQYRSRFKGDKLPPKILQGFLQCWLAALDYMHTEAHVVHTDIKDDNILMTFEHPSILSDFSSQQKAHPAARKHLQRNNQHTTTIYRSHPSFGPLQTLALDTRLVDFGVSHRMNPDDKSQRKLFPIQPRYYRAPEVILGAGWSYAADIWNLGVLVFTLMEDHHLFHHVNAKDHTYDVKKHLAQMYALLGPVPAGVLKSVEQNCRGKFKPAMTNDAGEECDDPRSYFGGPYFDDGGHFLFPEMVPEGLAWGKKVHAIEDVDEREQFFRFVKKMITWDPAERATAAELLRDEWVTRKFVMFG